MRWTVSEAREHLAAVLEAARAQPQALYRRDELVGGVVDAETLAALSHAQRPQPSLGDAFAALRALTESDGPPWTLPARENRANAFAPEDDAPAV